MTDKAEVLEIQRLQNLTFWQIKALYDEAQATPFCIGEMR